MPLPIGSVSITDKQTSLPFPCQDSPCGCKTAEQCWTNCCCKTPAQRLAWAKSNGVTPPKYAMATLEKFAQPITRVVLRKVGAAPPSQSIHQEPKRPCCTKLSDRSQVRAEETRDTKNFKPTVKRKIILSVVALKCQGGSSDFTMLPWMIPATVESVRLSVTAQGAAPQVGDLRPLCVDLNLDTPPPKRSLG